MICKLGNFPKRRLNFRRDGNSTINNDIDVNKVYEIIMLEGMIFSSIYICYRVISLISS
jgi:hypothetical protein